MRTPLVLMASRNANGSSSPRGLHRHCIWLRVKIWIASAPTAAPLAGALARPPVVGTWAPRNMGQFKPTRIETGGAMAQVALPEDVTTADASQVQERILAARQALGSR